MEIYHLPNKEFKIAILWKLNELQENTERQFNKIRKTVHDKRRSLTKRIEIIKKNQTEIVALKKSMNEIKTALESISCRLDRTELVRLKTGTLKLSREEQRKNIGKQSESL